jgi:hypothetical protein
MPKKPARPEPTPALDERQRGFLEDVKRIPRTSFTADDALEFVRKVRTGELTR